MTYPSPVAAAGIAGTVAGLSDDERFVLDELWRCWTIKMRRNLLRAQYYDQRNCLKDLGIGIPPHMTDLELVLGWPAKAVDVLARRCKFERFTLPSADDDPLGLADLWVDNDMDVELPQAVSSALLHSCVFVMATKGDASVGEPEVLISTQSALFGSGLWDYRLRRLRAAFSVVNADFLGRTTEWVMFLPKLTIRGRHDGRRWEIDRYPHTLDRLPVEVLPYKPRLDRPFGTSRISRAVMGLSDSAFRTMVRLESHAEFFSGPQRYAMGADESMFVNTSGETQSQWQAIMGRVWTAPFDEDGNAPQMGQFPATAPTPHTEQIRTLASLFCGETSLPLSALGIVHENPASAEAIEAAERDLIIEARYAMDCFGPRLARIARTAVEIRDGGLPDSAKKLGVRWSAPENTPASAAADAVTKFLTAVPWTAETSIPFKMMDWDASETDWAMAQKRTATAALVTNALKMAPPARSAADGGKPAGAAVPPKPGKPVSGS